MSAIKIKSKFSGSCKLCNGKYRMGDTVLWTPGAKGAAHVLCPDLSEGTAAIDVPTLFKLEEARTRKDFPSLFKHQQEVVNTLAKQPDAKLYLAWAPGLGKTLGSLASAQVSNNFPLIIVCPSVVKINWQREAERWIGKEAQILSGKKPFEITSDVVIINYDILDSWVEPLVDLNAKGIVFDEAHYIKNHEAKRSKAAKEIADSIDGMKFMLSGTPTPNSVHDLVMPLDILGALEHFGGRRTYVNRYCPPVQTRYGVAYSKTHNRRELHENLKKSCLIRRRREDCLDLPEKIRVRYPVKVKPEIDPKFYKPFIEAMNEGTLEEAKRVLEEEDSDNLYDEFLRERLAVGKAKVPHIAEIASDTDEPLVIMVHHKEVVDDLMHRLRKRKPVKLVGGMTPKARQASIDAFQDGDTDLIICSITAAGVGINLQRGTQMIIGELPFTYAEIEQAESRCHRSGAKNDLTVTTLVAMDTSDDIINGVISRKEATSLEVEDGEELVVSAPVRRDALAKRLLRLYLTHHGRG